VNESIQLKNETKWCPFFLFELVMTGLKMMLPPSEM
jgi:hypothetical protein